MSAVRLAGLRNRVGGCPWAECGDVEYVLARLAAEHRLSSRRLFLLILFGVADVVWFIAWASRVG